MKYKVGFYYHLPQHLRTDANIIIVFNGNNLEFREIKRSFFPGYEYPHIHEYCLDEPILYLENESGDVIDADFISSIPIRTSRQLTNQGFELYIPFYEYEESINPCIGRHLTTGRVGRANVDCTLLKDGVNLFPLPRFDSFEWRKKSDDDLKPYLQDLFAHYVLCYYFLWKVNYTISTENLSLSLFSFYLDKPWKNFYLQQIERINSYLQGIDIEAITDGLSIKIAESFYRKIGHDDEYSVVKETNVKDETFARDIYLNHLLQLGERDIYFDRGYRPAETMRIEGLQTGFLRDEELEKEKMLIKKKYSKSSHMAFLLSEVFSTIMGNQYYSHSWEMRLIDYYNVLINDFGIRDFHDCIKEPSSIIRDKEREYHRNMSKVIDDLNDMIRDYTVCSLSLNTAVKLQSVYLESTSHANFENRFRL